MAEAAAARGWKADAALAVTRPRLFPEEQWPRRSNRLEEDEAWQRSRSVVRSMRSSSRASSAKSPACLAGSLGQQSHRGIVMAHDRIKRLERSLEALKRRRFECAAAIGDERLGQGEPERIVDELMATHEAVKVIQEIIAEEERMVSRH
jgi:hypothetical protein